MAKTSKKDFESFQTEAGDWIETFGLKSWDVIFTHKEDKDSLASCIAESASRFAILNLSTSNFTETEVRSESVRKAAFHEVCELLMWEITTLLRVFFSEDVVNKKTHEVIVTLENAVFE